MPSILFRPKPNVEKTPAAPKASPLCCGSLQPTNQSTNMSTALNNNSTRSIVPGTEAISDAEQLALATGAAMYRWEELTKTPVNPSLLLNPTRYGDGAKDLWTTSNCVQENIIRGAFARGDSPSTIPPTPSELPASLIFSKTVAH